MENRGYTKFTWVINNFEPSETHSDEFEVEGCKWRLRLNIVQGDGVKDLSLYLEVAGCEFLPVGWSREARFFLIIPNPRSPVFTQSKARQGRFDADNSNWGFNSMVVLKEPHERNQGFLANGELKIVAWVSVLEVIGKSEVPEESEKNSEDLINLEENDSAAANDLQASSLIDVNDFEIHTSKVEIARSIFERCPNIASEFPENDYVRSACMEIFLNLIQKMCKSTHEISKNDLKKSNTALAILTVAGINVKWLEEKIKTVSKKKEVAEAGETLMRVIEEELKELNLKCSDLESQLKELKHKSSVLESQLEKERAVVYLARAPLTLDMMFDGF